MDHKRKERDFDSHGEDVVNATLSRLRAQSAPREDVETPAQAPAVEEPAPKRVVRQAVDGQTLLAEAEKDTQVEVVDAKAMKRLALSFERKLKENTEARMKHAGHPEKFLESEIDLHQELKRLTVLASAPDLYPELVRLGTHMSLLEVLAHENKDIACDAVEVLKEMTGALRIHPENPSTAALDSDALEDDEEALEGSKALVQAIIDANGLELLVTCLNSFDEKEAEESQAVHNVLAVLENFLELVPTIADDMFEKTRLLKWLLTRLRVREFDANKLYASELLSMYLQASDKNKAKMGNSNGVDLLLQMIAPFKGREPADDQEQELVENYFDALCSCLMFPDNKGKFVEAEGVELMLLVIKGKHFARTAALKALDFALTRCPMACDRFVDALGLKTVFTCFLGRGAGAAKKKRGAEAADEEEQRSVSVIASLFQGLVKGSRRDRLAAKFVEDEFAKVDRLVDLWVKYSERVRAAEEKMMQGEDAEEMDDEDRYLARLDGGLFTLQMVGLIIAQIWVIGHSGINGRMLRCFGLQGGSLKEVRWVLREYIENLGDSDGEEEKGRLQGRLRRLAKLTYAEGEVLDEEDDGDEEGEGGEAAGGDGQEGRAGDAGATNGEEDMDMRD